MTEFRSESPFLNQMKHSNSANKIGQNTLYPVTIKVKKEGAVKLNKILFNLQPSVANKTIFAKPPKSANTSIQNSSILEKQVKVSFKKKPIMDSPPIEPQNNSSSGMIRVINASTKLKPRSTHTRSLSNGHFRPIERVSMNDTTMRHYMNATPVKIDENTPSTQIYPLGTQVKGFKIGASANISKNEDSLNQTKMDMDSYTRSLKRHTRQQKSINVLKHGALMQELDVSLPKLQRKLTAREDKSTAEDSEIKQVKNEESRWRCLIFNTTVEKEVLEAHLKLVTEGLHYAISFLKPPSLAYVESRQVILDKKHREGIKTLVLDLDETLIRSCQPEHEPDMTLTPKGVTDQKLHIKVRPFTSQFLNLMKEHFEIIVFTASSELYANTIVNALDPKKECISYLFHRGFCFETNKGIRIKDLRIFKNRDLKDIIIVDNFVPAFSFQIENGVPILEWVGDKKDKELKFIANYLLKAKEADDIREFNRKNLNLLELAKTHLPTIAP